MTQSGTGQTQEAGGPPDWAIRVPRIGQPVPQTPDEIHSEIVDLLRARQMIEARITLLFDTFLREMDRAAVRLNASAATPHGRGDLWAQLTKTEQVMRAMPGTQPEIIERTGIDRATVSALLARLRREGRVRVAGARQDHPGAGRRLQIYERTDEPAAEPVVDARVRSTWLSHAPGARVWDPWTRETDAANQRGDERG